MSSVVDVRAWPSRFDTVSDVCPRGEQLCRDGVPQVMDAYFVEPDPFSHAAPLPAHHVGAPGPLAESVDCKDELGLA
jgi:hypothetical protein